MNIWKRVREILPAWPLRKSASATAPTNGQQQHLVQAADSLRALLDDPRIPEAAKVGLEADYRQIEAMAEKLARGQVHIAVFGRVSTGKSSLLNALLGSHRFAVGPLHGVTQHSEIAQWTDFADGGVHLLDTPGIDELDGEERERLAYQVSERCDLVLFVVDSDLTEGELIAIKTLAAQQRPMILVLNKIDRYTHQESALLLSALRRHTNGIINPEHVVGAAADPAPERVIRVDTDGREHSDTRHRPAQLEALTACIWQVLEKEGKTLAALNAALFAERLNREVAVRVSATRHEIAEKVTRTYCLAKGLTVALNPIPVADLLAAATIDIALVKHLSQVYGLPMTQHESGRLIATIVAQLAALMGAVWGVNLVSSALKGLSAGLSVTVTAGAQGALAWYATYLVGRAAEQYLIEGKSWGPQGPKKVIKEIVNDLDQASILSQARTDILARLGRGSR